MDVINSIRVIFPSSLCKSAGSDELVPRVAAAQVLPICKPQASGGARMNFAERSAVISDYSIAGRHAHCATDRRPLWVLSV
jgi:hypothetical protein